MKVDIEEVLKHYNRRREINKQPLEDISFYYNGVKLTILEELINKWRFTGLNNVDFILQEIDPTSIIEENIEQLESTLDLFEKGDIYLSEEEVTKIFELLNTLSLIND